MEVISQYLATLSLLGVATWAGTCFVLFMFVRPNAMRLTEDWTEDWAKPAAFAAGAVAFGLLSILALPGSGPV